VGESQQHTSAHGEVWSIQQPKRLLHLTVNFKTKETASHKDKGQKPKLSFLLAATSTYLSPSSAMERARGP